MITHKKRSAGGITVGIMSFPILARKPVPAIKTISTVNGLNSQIIMFLGD